MRVGKPKFVAADICSPERLSAMVHKFGHEVGNPLTSIISVATLLGRYAAQPEHLEAHLGKFPEYTAAVCREAWRIAALTERLVLIHSDRKGEAAPTSLRRSLARAHETVKKHPPFEESHLEWRGEDATAYVDADLLHYQLVALLENAFQATEVLPTDFRPLHVEAMASNLEQSVELVVSNIRAEACSLELDQLFEPFVFENPLSKRNGLGLTLVAALAERLDGSIEIREQSAAHGFNFQAVLTLPRRDEAVRKSPAPATPQRPTTRWSDAISKLPDKITVAIVDDDMGISSAIEKILSLVFQKHLQFGCIKFSGPEFIAEIDKLEFFDAVVCDVNLGAVSGRFIYETLRERFPEQLNSFAFLTGERLSHEIQAFLESSGCPYLHKPFDAEYLINLVIELIEKGATKRSS